MKGSPDMIDALENDVRAGACAASAVTSPSRSELMAGLEAVKVKGQLAHERDCLLFMATSWPWPQDRWVAEDTFSKKDLIEQIDDVRRFDVDGELEDLLAALEVDIVGRGPTEQ